MLSAVCLPQATCWWLVCLLSLKPDGSRDLWLKCVSQLVGARAIATHVPRAGAVFETVPVLLPSCSYLPGKIEQPTSQMLMGFCSATNAWLQARAARRAAQASAAADARTVLRKEAEWMARQPKVCLLPCSQCGAGQEQNGLQDQQSQLWIERMNQSLI